MLYLKHRSLLMDIEIVLKTIKTPISRSGTQILNSISIPCALSEFNFVNILQNLQVFGDRSGLLGRFSLQNTCMGLP